MGAIHRHEPLPDASALPWQRRREALEIDHRGTAGDATDRAVDVDQALAQLPATARMVVWMHCIEGCTHEEIGRAFGYTPQRLKLRLDARCRASRLSGLPSKAIHFFGPERHMVRRIRRADPELELVDIGEDLGKYFGVDSGVLVLDTPPGSNLKPGDILRRVDDADIRNAEEAHRLLADLDEDGTAAIRRENRSRNVKVEPVEGMNRHFNDIMRGHEDSGQEVEEEIEVELETTDEEHSAATAHYRAVFRH